VAKSKFPCPKWLDKEAQKEWKRVIKELGENTELKTVDLKALEGYCQSYSKWLSCEKVMQQEGYTFQTSNGYVQQRPEVSISKQALADMRAFQKELGLTPAARSRMNKSSTNTNGEDTDPEMEDMIVK
jgi:P27 family predicted phage terminase small subunit